MLTLIKQEDYKETPWKNGKGKTREIAIFPPGSSLENDDFLWRLSSAPINDATTFSLFPRCERILFVWRGGGLVIDGAPLLPHNPFFFSGHKETKASPLEGKPIVDVGLIYDPNEVQAFGEVLSYEQSTELTLLKGVHYLFLAEGEQCEINTKTLTNGGTLKVESEEKISILTSKKILLYKISLLQMKS